MVEVLVSSVAQQTGALLKSMLVGRGIYSDKGDAVVCYGQSYLGPKPALNPHCSRGKIYNMSQMTTMGVRTVPWFQGSKIPHGVSFPLLARKSHGYGGLGIIPVFQPEEIPWRVAAGWTWFSQYVPISREYRAWVFRDHVLDVYEKQMARPARYRGIGRNFGNGFEFVHRTSYPSEVARQAALAIEALEYDFAAVDLLEGKDGQIYVLEANAAPGVIRSRTQGSLGKLVDEICEWHKAVVKEKTR